MLETKEISIAEQFGIPSEYFPGFPENETFVLQTQPISEGVEAKPIIVGIPFAEGNEGTVHLCWVPDSEDQQGQLAAIKFAKEFEGGSQDQPYFTRLEAQVQEYLSQHSEHIIQVLDYGTAPEGNFIVMELLKGKRTFNLYDRLKQLHENRADHFSLDELTAISQGLKSIMQTLHDHPPTEFEGDITSKGHISYMDFKPHQLYLDRGTLKLGDFGLTSQILFEQSRNPDETYQIGTPEYWHPDMSQADEYLPKVKDITIQHDLHPAALTLYECITGEMFKLSAEGELDTEGGDKDLFKNVDARISRIQKLERSLYEIVGIQAEKTPKGIRVAIDEFINNFLLVTSPKLAIQAERVPPTPEQFFDSFNDFCHETASFRKQVASMQLAAKARAQTQ